MALGRPRFDPRNTRTHARSRQSSDSAASPLPRDTNLVRKRQSE